MPLTGNVRLDRAARDKIKALLRGLYNHWLAQGIPERLAVTVRKVGGEPAGRSRHQPAADRGVR
jgi:hypothetical protein